MFPCDVPPEDRAHRPSLPLTVTGGCHCGRVRYRATVRSWRLSECNCSLCTKKGYEHVIVAGEDFELLQGKESLSTYGFNTRTAKHHFCAVCGVHSFYVPRSHPDGFSLNARCLDDVDPGWFDREHFDGRNWEAAIHTLR